MNTSISESMKVQLKQYGLKDHSNLFQVKPKPNSKANCKYVCLNMKIMLFSISCHRIQ
jgi:hypothetical protein